MAKSRHLHAILNTIFNSKHFSVCLFSYLKQNQHRSITRSKLIFKTATKRNLLSPGFQILFVRLIIE